MKKIIVVASFLIFAGVAHGQTGATINSYSGIGDSAGLGGAPGLGAGSGIGGSPNINLPTASGSVPSAPAAAADRDVNQNSKNPGNYVPSRFTNYREAVALGEVESGMRPLTVAEAARMAQARKKNASQRPAIVLDRDENGKLVIAPTAKK